MLTKRLMHCLEYIKGFDTVMDVGTDHAYLPIAAIKQGYVNHALAIDNKEGPLLFAKQNIESMQMTPFITPIKTEGIDALTDAVNVIVIAGMGGKTIFDILHQKDYRNVERFVLQPNNQPQNVRQLTQKNDLKILDEIIIEDQGIPYIIIVLERGKQNLTDKEIALGPLLLKSKPSLYYQVLKEEHRFLSHLIKQIPEPAAVPIRNKITLLEEVFDEWHHD